MAHGITGACKDRCLVQSWEVGNGFLQMQAEGAGQAEGWELCVRQREQPEQRLCSGDGVWSACETWCPWPQWARGGRVGGAGTHGAYAAWGLTFIMSTMVLRAIMAMMVYSKGGDTTNCHIRYWKLCLFWGMCRVSGLALMAKSMQALCRREAGGVRAGGRRAPPHPTGHGSPAHLLEPVPSRDSPLSEALHQTIFFCQQLRLLEKSLSA